MPHGSSRPRPHPRPRKGLNAPLSEIHLQDLTNTCPWQWKHSLSLLGHPVHRDSGDSQSLLQILGDLGCLLWDLGNGVVAVKATVPSHLSETPGGRPSLSQAWVSMSPNLPGMMASLSPTPAGCHGAPSLFLMAQEAPWPLLEETPVSVMPGVGGTAASSLQLGL